MALTNVPVLDPADQGAPSTQEIALIADSTNSKSLTKISQANGVKTTINLELNCPSIDSSKFGVEIAFPPSGYYYVFLDFSNGNQLSQINSAGVVTPIGVSATGATTIPTLTVTGVSRLQGNVALGLGGDAITERKVLFSDDGTVAAIYFPASNILQIGGQTGTTAHTKIIAPKVTIATGVLDEIGFFGTTPAGRGIVALAAPVLLADCIDQIEQLKAALGQVAGNGLVQLS